MGEGFGKHVWKIMIVLSVGFIVWTLFMMSEGDKILPTAFELAGSTQTTENIEKSALDFMNMSMLKPLWEGLWMGILGLLIAFGLKGKIKYAWKLGMFWGIMMVGNATIQGSYEVLILGWPSICLQTIMFLVFGIGALVSLSVSKKYFS